MHTNFAAIVSLQDGECVQAQLDVNTALLATGHQVICCFVNDDLSKDVVNKLAEVGVRWVSLLKSTL